jgi:hypothetical protein
VRVLSEESGDTPAIYAEVTGTDTYAAEVRSGPAVELTTPEKTG